VQAHYYLVAELQSFVSICNLILLNDEKYSCISYRSAFDPAKILLLDKKQILVATLSGQTTSWCSRV
jgi:hypothetical protein